MRTATRRTGKSSAVFWKRNNQRLEAIIKNELSGARQRKYDNYSRTDYPTIIDRLYDDDVLTKTARDKSIDLHRMFMSYKSRRKPVTNEVVANARVLDKQLTRSSVLAVSCETSVSQKREQPALAQHPNHIRQAISRVPMPGTPMAHQTDKRELSIRGYARETALCVDLPLSAVEEQILAELKTCTSESLEVLQRLLRSVREHRQIVAGFTKPN